MLKNTKPDNHQKKELKRIALFLNTLLKIELIKGLVYPEFLNKPFKDLDHESKKEWLKYTSEKVFSLARAETKSHLGRELYKSEAGLIEHRVNEFLRKYGLENKI
jgi:hypothetical protein